MTGKKWQDVLDARLFTPLGMDRTTAYMSEARKRRIAAPYNMTDAGTMVLLPYGWKDDSMMHAAGGLVTTPADLAKWLKANLDEGPAFAETHRQQVRTQRPGLLFNSNGYGFGWYQSDFHGERAIFHGGGFEGWRSVYSFLPERKIGAGVLTNSGFSHSPAELISGYVYDRLMNVPGVEKTYADKLAEVRKRFDTVIANRIADAAARAQRPWKLQHPLSAYAGQYESPEFGTLTIEQRGNKLVASLGRLSGELQPFTEPDSARVELVPGTGEPLRFVFTTAATADAVRWGEELMARKTK